MIQIAPSLLAADFSRLWTELERVSDADMLHLDVMDGHFVPNISLGQPVISALRKVTALTFDVHLMLSHPLRYIEDFRKAGADIISFHIECEDDPAAVLDEIERVGAKPALAIKPATPVSAIAPFLNRVYMVTVMTVEPGFGGQKLMPAPLEKIAEIKALAPNVLTQVDGGVNRETVQLVKQKGADILVAGSAVFTASDPKEEIEALKAL